MRAEHLPLLALLAACGRERPAEPGVFVLGVDGMDPVIVTRMMEEGKLPNLAKLAAEGGFQSLGTSTPPQSPVAWSTFVTGMDPGGHGVFDFIHRDPKTYTPTSSATAPIHDPGSALELFGWYLPLGGDPVENNRSGTPWWDLLHEAGVDVEAWRVPGNYPPPASDARVLSGMGTVDMRGGYGVYTWLTDQAVLGKGELKGDIQLVNVEDYDLDGSPDTVRATIKGAPDIFHLPPGQAPGEGDYLTAPVTISLDPDQDLAFIRAGDDVAILKPGEWSPWMTLKFDALPWGMMPLDGNVRFYARQLRPNLEIYASPVNISAENPAQTISSPDDFATEIFDRAGHYYTQGMPEETNALKDRTFNDDDYESQVKQVQQEAERLLDLALDRYAPGDATFFYLSDIDLQCHMLWRLGDPKYPGAPPHPAFEPDAAVNHADDIEGYYRDVDRLVGRVRWRLPADSLLIVMSDHGFQPFTREVHLNAWLRDQGYLVLKDGKKTGKILMGDVDWSKTRAYGLGFNGLYLNLQGREGEGVVAPADREALLAELQQKLLAFTDPVSGAPVVKRVDRATEVYKGARAGEAPDLVVGYDRGYGCSDESTLGEITELTLEDNTDRWSGNHLMAPEVVPGVLFSNRKIPGEGYGLADVTATLVSWYGLDLPAEMTGKPILTH